MTGNPENYTGVIVGEADWFGERDWCCACSPIEAANVAAIVNRTSIGLYVAMENIITPVTRAKSPQTKGICERFHRTVQEEFYSVAFRKKLYNSPCRII
jgi:hypothetical protein